MGDKMISSKAFEKAMRETREAMYANLLSGRPLPVKRENWKDRLKLAWAVLRGRITWGDIG